MVKRNRLRNGRHKAQFGADGAIMAAATLASAAMNAAATHSSAKEQAEATEKAANINAQALTKQNENATKLQEQTIQFNREENERNRTLQRDIQMNLQLLAGQQNTNDMREAAKIQVRNGGSIRKVGSGKSKLSLRGNKIPGITTPNQGNYVPLAFTDNGILAIIKGPNHSNGGVDIDVNGNKDIEAEGGELMHVKFGLGGNVKNKGIKDVQFISKHTIPGTNLNPAREVMIGRMTPDEAFVNQEVAKDINGVSDDGKHNSKSPLRRMAYSGLTYTPQITPDLSLDYLAPVATGVAYDYKNRQAKYGRCLKACGGRRKVRYGNPPKGFKYWDGDLYFDENVGELFNNAPNTAQPPTYNQAIVNPQTNTTTQPGGDANPSPYRSNLIGAGIAAGANLTGALITTLANNSAKRTLSAAYDRAANTMRNAYAQMHGIDMSNLRRSDFAAAHEMAALQAPIVSKGADRAMAERAYMRELRNIGRNTLSGAATLDRNAKLASGYYDLVGKISQDEYNARQDIIRGNLERIQHAASENANRDTQANQAYANAYLNLLQYNNEIENEKIMGAAQVGADRITQIGGLNASTRQANAASWAGALTGSATQFSNAIGANTKLRLGLEQAKLNAEPDALYNYYMANPWDKGIEGFITKYKGDTGNYKDWSPNLIARRNSYLKRRWWNK